MSRTGRRLGRGLSSLVSQDVAVSEKVSAGVDYAEHSALAGADSSSPVKDDARYLAADELMPNPFQPRSVITNENVISLAESIKRNGLLQPIVVRRKGQRFEIIAGERRWTAAKSLGMSRVPVTVRDATDEQMLEFALIENIHRKDLNAIERAKAYREFRKRFGLTPEQVAHRLGEDRTTVTNYLRLLDLSEDIQFMVARGSLTMGHARCLLGLDEETRRRQLAESVVGHGLSVRALEEIVRRERTHTGPYVEDSAKTPRRRPAHLEDMEFKFEQAVKTKVRIQEGRRKGTGRIIIEYYSLDDFDRIAQRLAVPLE